MRDLKKQGFDISGFYEEDLSKPNAEKVNAEFENRIERASGVLGTDSVFYQNGHWLTEGETLVQPELKTTLQTLS